MIVFIDGKIASILSEMLGVDASSIVYGRLPVARNFWVRHNEGIEKLPYVSFFREIDFGERRDVQTVNVKTSGESKAVKFTPIVLKYTVEHIGDSVMEQTNMIRDYMFWVNDSPTFEFDSVEGDPWVLGGVFEAPEDNSDLEDEEESGRIVRTTFSFEINAYLTSESVISGVIDDILASIYLYDGVVDDYVVKVADIEVDD